MKRLQMHVKSYQSDFSRNGQVHIKDIIATHSKFEPLLHRQARQQMLDIDALTYCCFRLPRQVFFSASIHIASSRKDAPLVETRARRACWQQDPLTIIARSWSDIHDVVSNCTVLQVEWNKIHRMLARLEGELSWDAASQALGIDEDAMVRLDLALHRDSLTILEEIRKTHRDTTLVLDPSIIKSNEPFEALTTRFAEQVARTLEGQGLEKRNILLISSNMHSIANQLSGFAFSIENRLVSFIHETKDPMLLELLDQVTNRRVRQSSKRDFLYYVSKKYIAHHKLYDERLAWEENCGITTCQDLTGANVSFQVMDPAKLIDRRLDRRLLEAFWNIPPKKLAEYAIVNIDYPFGLQARYMLDALMQRLRVTDVFVLGKAGGFKGEVGDHMVPARIIDDSDDNEQDRQVSNLIEDKHFTGGVYQQRFLGVTGISSKGTIIMNRLYLEASALKDISFVEMEAGPFLAALRKHGRSEAGMIYYLSDLPLAGATLVQNLSFSGAHATYSASAALLNCLFSRMA
ncbi:hypothetical protein AUJ68_05210 [Candidatus Woesearchaeota archaeon CG1_02_57_44]|nr:MAG: hypothetical protein AUJ68_05210 [Candidatus Woesearchaeota archaeon CG1_02_57_44]PIN68620.1 MAG: hypothetical protein COV94_03905 [Candidatus Woesearchaeota archaeon CG11_big_fil_rev_8_21_14_0_20_57_5]